MTCPNIKTISIPNFKYQGIQMGKLPSVIMFLSSWPCKPNPEDRKNRKPDDRINKYKWPNDGITRGR